MKKFLTFLLLLTMLCSCAMADSLTDCAIANGNVQAVHYVDITAPYSGTLSAFTVESGDSVKAGDALFSMLTTTIYATEEGVVQAIFGEGGADAAALSARMGRTVTLTCTVDESLLGGLTVCVDGKVLDGSLRHRLHAVKDVMKQ